MQNFNKKSNLNENIKQKFLKKNKYDKIEKKKGRDQKKDFTTTPLPKYNEPTDFTWIPQILGLGEGMSSITNALRNVEVNINDESLKKITEALSNINIQHTIPEISGDIGNQLYDLLSKFLLRSERPIEINHNNVLLDMLHRLKPVWPLLLVVILIYLYKSDRISGETILFLVGFFGVLYFPEVVDKVKLLVKRYLPGSQPQNTFSISETFFSIFTLYNFGKDLNPNNIMKMFNIHLRDYDRVKIGASSWLNDTVMFIQKIINFFRINIFGKDEWIFYLGSNKTLTEYLVKINKFLMEKEEVPSLSLEDGDIIKLLYDEGLSLNKHLTEPLDRQRLSYVLAQLTPLRNKLKCGQWEGAGARVPPLVILFAGDSQIGKSTMMMSLVYRVLARSLKGDRLARFLDHPEREIFSYNWDREHQDGADKQAAYFFDDIGCTNDIAGEKGNVYQALIRITNIVPAHMHMAALEAKVDSLFKGQFIFMTTNRQTWDLKSIYYTPAFVKRLHLCFQADVVKGMKMPKEVDPHFAFDFISFKTLKYDEHGVQPPTVGSDVGGYLDVVDMIIRKREEMIAIGESLRDTAKLEIAQGLFDRQEIELAENYLDKVNLVNTKTSYSNELTMNKLRKFLRSVDTAMKHNPMADGKLVASSILDQAEGFALTEEEVSNLNRAYEQGRSKLVQKHVGLLFLFPMDYEELVLVRRRYIEKRTLKAKQREQIRNITEGNLPQLCSGSDYESATSAPNSGLAPQMKIDIFKEPQELNFFPTPEAASVLAFFIPTVAIYDVNCNVLQPVRDAIQKTLAYDPRDWNWSDGEEEYRGSLSRWMRKSRWIGFHNCCDCCLCDLNKFNVPVGLDRWTVETERNQLSGSALARQIYLHILGNLTIADPDATSVREEMKRFLIENTPSVASYFNYRRHTIANRIRNVEDFLDSLSDEGWLPLLCLNSTAFIDFMDERQGFAMYFVMYLRIMREINLNLSYKRKSFAYKYIKSGLVPINKKVVAFRQWASENSETIARVTVFTTLVSTFLFPYVNKFFQGRAGNKHLLVNSMLFRCSNVIHSFGKDRCVIDINCHKCRKKITYVLNTQDLKVNNHKFSNSIDCSYTMNVLLDSVELEGSLYDPDYYGEYNVYFTKGNTVAVPTREVDGVHENLCCNSAKFNLENMKKAPNVQKQSYPLPDGSDLIKREPLNLIPQTLSHDVVEHQIGRKIALGNSIILHGILLHSGPVPTEEDYKMALGKKQCSILMLGDRIGLMPNHIYSYLMARREEGSISVQQPAVLSYANDPNSRPFFWVPEEDQFHAISSLRNKDLVVVRLPTIIVKNFSHLKKYFVSEKDVRPGTTYNGNLWTPGGKNSLEIRSAPISDTAHGSADYMGYQNGVSWRYPICTEGGDCGSFLTMTNPSSGSRKIVGIHTAGDPSVRAGTSVRIFQETVNIIFDYFEENGETQLQDSNYLEKYEPQMNSPNDIHTPYCPMPQARERFRSTIVNAPLHHVGVVTHIPADPRPISVDGEIVKPYKLAMSKNVPAHVLLDINLLNTFRDYYVWFYARRSTYSFDPRRMLTTMEAISGCSDDPYLRPVNRSSSLGPPYKWKLLKKDPSLKGKQEAFGKEEYLYDTPLAKEIIEEVEDFHESNGKGTRTIQYFEDAFKDEVLPREKVQQGKGRLYSVGGIVLLLEEKKEYGLFDSWFMHNRIYNESGIGMNVFGDDWHRMIRYLLFDEYELSDKRIFKAIDIKKFDGVQSRPFMYTWMDMKSNFYEPGDRFRKMTLSENAFNSFHISKGVAYERYGSNSSGKSGTGIDNTGVLGLKLAYAALVIYQKTFTGTMDPIIHMSSATVYAFLDEFHAHNRFMKYGDDVLNSTNPRWKYFDDFSEDNLIDALHVIGVEATSDSKDEGRNYYRYLDEVSFLKRVNKFNSRHKRYVGCLAITSIMKSVHWLKKENTPITEYYNTLDKALQELSLHETKEARFLIDEIIREGRKIGFIPRATSEKILQDLCLSRTDYT